MHHITRIIGIDPGTTRIGYGIIEQGSNLSLISYGVIEIGAVGEADRLMELGVRLDSILIEFSPILAGVETLYFSKNQKTALTVSQARGVILYLLRKHGIQVIACRPTEVKIALTSYGAADKQAVTAMVKHLLSIDEVRGPDDASDALAIAITAGCNISQQQQSNA